MESGSQMTAPSANSLLKAGSTKLKIVEIQHIACK